LELLSFISAAVDSVITADAALTSELSGRLVLLLLVLLLLLLLVVVVDVEDDIEDEDVEGFGVTIGSTSKLSNEETAR